MWDKIKNFFRKAISVEITESIDGKEVHKWKRLNIEGEYKHVHVHNFDGVLVKEFSNSEQSKVADTQEHLYCLQGHIETLKEENKSLKRTGDLNTATIENTFAIISAKDAEIADLKKQIKNMRIIGGEMNDYDVPMKGMQL